MPRVESDVAPTCVGAAGATAARDGARRCSKRGTMPCGMNKIAAISTAPVVALPASARSPFVNAYNSAVITVAPTAGPAQ